MDDEEALKAAFLLTYRSMAHDGLVRSDEEVAEQLFQQFRQDLEDGFPSIFKLN